jgi:excisionase family DNA binding protein
VLVALASPLVCAGHYKDRIVDCQQIYGRRTIDFQNAILWAMKVISTAEAAKRLGVTANRVRAMIEAKRLKATKVGNVWLIDPKDLDAVKDRKVGRPRKSRKSAKK